MIELSQDQIEAIAHEVVRVIAASPRYKCELVSPQIAQVAAHLAAAATQKAEARRIK